MIIQYNSKKITSHGIFQPLKPDHYIFLLISNYVIIKCKNRDFNQNIYKCDHRIRFFPIKIKNKREYIMSYRLVYT